MIGMPRAQRGKKIRLSREEVVVEEGTNGRNVFYVVQVEE